MQIPPYLFLSVSGCFEPFFGACLTAEGLPRETSVSCAARQARPPRHADLKRPHTEQLIRKGFLFSSRIPPFFSHVL